MGDSKSSPQDPSNVFFEEKDEKSTTICSICLEVYDEKSNIPRVLLCGHTFCSLCISKFLSFGRRSCPECQVVIEGKVTAIPKNFSILRGIDSSGQSKPKKKKEPSIQEILNRISTLLESKRSFSSALLEQLDFYHYNYEGILADLDADRGLRNQYWLKKEAEELLITLDSLRDPSHSFNISSDHEYFRNPTDNLMKILLSVRRGQRNYAFHDLRGQRLYGKITEGEDSLHIHALTSTRPEDPLASLTLLNHIQDFEGTQKIIFMDFSWNSRGARIYIELTDTLPAKQFYLLCTGERGFHYVGSAFVVKDGAIRITEHLSGGQRESFDILPNLEVLKEKEEWPYEGYIFRNPEKGKGGTFRIQKVVAKEKLQGRIGQVTSSLKNLMGIDGDGIIEDSGIFIKVSK